MQNRNAMIVAVGLCVATVVISGCRARVLRHDPEQASRVAVKFMQKAVLQEDSVGAFDMLPAEGKASLTAAGLADAVAREHKRSYPVAIRATEYEPVLGQAVVQVFLEGENSQEKFYYRVPVLGTADAGYHPGGFFRGSGPYPASTLRAKLAAKTAQ